MFGKELNRSNNCYISQVAMIESKCEKAQNSFRKKVNMPAMVFTRSPLKDRENKSIVGNTPSRKNQNNMSRVLPPEQDQSRRTSVSPLKNRRQANNVGPSIVEPDPSGSYSSARILVPQLSGSINSHVSKSKKLQVCQNHPNKQAKYAISIDDEDMLYCDKCAISLASQGFKVVKFDDTAASILPGGSAASTSNVSLLDDSSHPRRQEISAFLGELEGIMQILGNKKIQIEGTISKSEISFQQQITELGTYYTQIIEDITSHRKAVETALLQQKRKAMTGVNATLETVNEAISDSNMMKQDIMSSLDLIKEAQEKDYRPIMESYKQNAKKFRSTSNKAIIQPINLTSLCLGDPTEVVQFFLNNLSAILTGQEIKKQSSNPKDQSNHSSINFSFEGHTKQAEFYRQQQQQAIPKMGSKILPGPISEDENPVELLSEEDLSKQKFMKSSLKDANGLFTEFDDFSV